MASKARSVAKAFALALTLGGVGYSVAAILAVRRFRLSPKGPADGPFAPITVLKPLHGEEPLLYENLRSFCQQSYPQYQVIFGAKDPNDPALAIARRLCLEFPELDLLVVGGTYATAAGNPKIANLCGMMGAVKHDAIAIADSDVRVDPNYLRALGSAFSDPRTGAVTCLYGAVPLDTVAARLGAMFVNDRFAPSVLVAAALQPLKHCFGATMAFRASVLRKIGGLESVADHLGDDYLLGRRVSAAGFRVALCRYVVRMTVSDATLGALARHEFRWMRTIRAAQPAGFSGSILTYPLPLACAYALLSRSLAGASVAAGVFALRLLQQAEAQRTFAPEVRSSPALLPLRDLLSLALWGAAWAGSGVLWRGERFGVQAGGRLRPAGDCNDSAAD